MSAAIPIALTIAGSDSSGGAGIQADLKTFSAIGVYGASVITALTAQNTLGVRAVQPVPAEFVAEQLDAVLSDLDVRAIKIGMAGRANTISAIAEALATVDVPIVLDPVLVATSGEALLDAEAADALRQTLLPVVDLVTPNLQEAADLLGQPVAADETEMRAQAKALQDYGPKAVLIKGGHGQGPEAVDIYFDGTHYDRVALPRIETSNSHGTGCTLSSAVAACMAHGVSMRDSVFRAKAFVTDALKYADDLNVGEGSGPLHHFHALWPAADGS